MISWNHPVRRVRTRSRGGPERNRPEPYLEEKLENSQTVDSRPVRIRSRRRTGSPKPALRHR